MAAPTPPLPSDRMTHAARPDSAARTLTIGLLWHSLGSENLGVGALTLSQIALCQEAAERAGVNLRFVVFGTGGGLSYGPPGTDIRIGHRISVKEMVTGRSGYVRDIEGCDLVLDIGEGDSFTDIYGLHRFMFLVASKLAVLLKGRPLVLSPQTIGPFEGRLTRPVAAALMRRCARVFARDGLSADCLRDLGVRERTDEVVDVAFRLPWRAPLPRPADDRRLHVGLNVSGLLFSGGYAGTNQFGLTIDYPTLVRRLLAHWCADPGVQVWLVSHVVPDHLPRDDDRIAAAALLAEFPAARSAPAFTSPVEAKSFIAGLDFMTGARMHACIAAFSAGVPVVPVAYSRKFNGLFSSLGYRWVADGKAMDTDQAFEAILDGLARRDQVEADLARGNAEAARRLDRYRDFLAAQFAAGR